jgi:hypothetical protein
MIKEKGKNENSKKREDMIGFCTLTWILKKFT